MVKPFGWIVAVGEVARLPLTSGLAWPWLPPPLLSKGKDKEFVSDPGNQRTGLRWKGWREPAEAQQCGNWTRAWTRIAEVKGLGSLVSEGRNHVTLKLGWLWLIHGNPPSPGRKGTCRFDSVPPFILFFPCAIHHDKSLLWFWKSWHMPNMHPPLNLAPLHRMDCNSTCRWGGCT